MPKLAGVNHEQAVRALQKAGFWVACQEKHTMEKAWIDADIWADFLEAPAN